MKRLFIVLVLALSAAHCGGSSPSTPTPAPAPANPLTGGWVGSATSQTIGTGAITATIVQSGTTLTGTWAVQYANAANNNSGVLTGTIIGTGVTLTLSPSVPTNCPYAVTAVLTGNTMGGSYATFNCSVGISGGFVLSKAN